MKFVSRENFTQGIVFRGIFHCGLMLFGIVILQAWPNESSSYSGTYNLIRYFFASNSDVHILAIYKMSCKTFLCQFCFVIPLLTQ